MAKKILPLIIIVILAVGLRLIIVNQSFWLDEAAQANMSLGSLTNIWSDRGGDFHPPLFYLLAHFWLSVNQSELWARLLPITFGITTIFIIYLLSDRLFPSKKVTLYHWDISAAHLAAFLLAINPYHIYYSQEFRSYSLLCFLGSLSMYFFIQKKYIWLTLVNLLLLYTHYSAIYIIFTELVLTIFYFRDFFPRYLVSLILSGILFLPWLPQFFRQLDSGLNIENTLPGWNQMLSTSTLKAVPTILFKFTAGRITFINRTVYAVYAALVFIVMGFAFLVVRLKSNLLHVWLFVPIFSMLIVSYLAPQNQPFRIIFCLIPLILIFTQSCFRFPKIMLTFLIYISLIGNITYFTRPRLQREQWRQSVAHLKSRPGLVLVKFPAAFAPLTWYGPDLAVVPLIPDFPLDVSRVSALVSGLPPSTRRVYLFDYLSDIVDPRRQVDRILVDYGFIPGPITDFSGVGFVSEYNRP